MPSLPTRLALALVVALCTAVPAQAAWEAPKRIDQNAEGFGNAGAGDVAVGDNGLATILFVQAHDDGTQLWATRRAADQADWLAPTEVLPLPSGLFTIEAAPDGSTAGAYRRNRTVDDGVPLTPNPTVRDVIGLGWASAEAEPETSDLGDLPNDALPPVDADGRGFGWTAWIDGGRDLQIRRFSLSDPSATPTPFTVEAIDRDPGANESLTETLSRSNPRLDVNADGDVIVSFVEERRTAEPDPELPAQQTGVWAVRKLNGQANFSAPFKISHNNEDDPVTDHDPAIVDNGDATIVFAADPNRAETHRVFARRWLNTSASPRPQSGIEFVSSSAANAPTVSLLRAEAGPTPQVTAAWLQGTAQLNSAERSTTWTLPETLSNSAAAYDIAVDVAGVATTVYREATAVRARRRASGQQWAAPDTISTAAVPTDFSPKVDAGAADQADAYIVQADGPRRAALGVRFIGTPPVEPPAPVRPDTEDCPGDIEVLAGDGGANTIAGGDGRETIMGGDGNDTLAGNGGDDCIRGQLGDDTVDGGDGNDDVGGGDGGDRVTGGEGDDRLTGDTGTDSMDGDAGNDIAGGGDGSDTIDGSQGNDLLNGEADDDNVRGGDGDDLLGGADGDDTVSGGRADDVLFGGLGNDRLRGGQDADTLVGEEDDDLISGARGPDTADGGLGNDRLRGGGGRNVLDGAEGDDRIRGGRGKDRILGSEGLDRMFGRGGNDRLDGGPDRDLAKGGAGKDRLLGAEGNDRLSGGRSRDVLDGGDGRDRIFGRRGNDRIVADDDIRDRINCGPGRDRVVADEVDRVSGNCERVRRVG